MAERLVDDMTEKWNPKPFKDEYREDVMRMIEKRIKAGATKTIVSSEEEEESAPRTEIRDLMPLLKKSLERRGKKGADEEEAAPPRRAAAAKKATKAAASRPKKKRTA
jgi:DNA end-binding protein Ku